MGEVPLASTASVEEAIEHYRRGDPVIVLEEGPQALGDITIPGQLARTRTVMFLIEHGGGVIYATLPESRCAKLDIPLQVPNHDSRRWQAEARVTVEARYGITTGISAADRVTTLGVLSDPTSTAHDIVRPGHVLPFGARPGGTIERPSITEASVDLARLAGLAPVGADAEILNPDGSRAVGGEVVRFSREHEVPLVMVRDIAAYRLRHDPSVIAVREHSVQAASRDGDFVARLYRDRSTSDLHLAFVRQRYGDDTSGLVAIAELCPLAAIDPHHSCRYLEAHREARREVAAHGSGAVIAFRVGQLGCPPFDEPAGVTDAESAALAQILKSCNILHPSAASAGTRTPTDLERFGFD